ncbi:MAG: tryptophan 2,3-dioxygenase family protein [Gemmatimonadota bacterium]|nr:tryptophan 2,3-dioxygenase family protein [Gemmatimonadota bacterium]
MPFGLPESEQKLTYGGYLRIRELLELQQRLSEPAQHDETLFIIIHQVYELWFKQLLHEVDAIIGFIKRDEVLVAHRLLRRCSEIQRVLVQQLSVLETMTPMDFLAFRDHLMPASGFQSAQFREMEIVSGLADPRALANYDAGTPERARLERRLGEPSLASELFALLERRGLGGDRVDAVVAIYRDAGRHYDLFLLCESLIEYDELFQLWRMRHVQMVERVIGSGRPGTGGSSGAGYLRSTVDRRFFPELWEVRNRLGASLPQDPEGRAAVGHLD